MSAFLQTQLSAPYRHESWQTILPQLFPRVEFFAQPADFPLTTERERSVATGRRQIGVATVPDDAGAEKRIAIYEIDVAANVDLPRNRVALRELVARSIDQASAHAVLAFFVQEGRAEYRLTYAARESSIDLETFEVTTCETAPKRFTFLLGPTEPCRTAAERLGELGVRRDRLAFKDVEQAFSVERLNKEFFQKYKDHYQAFVDYLIDETDAPEKTFGVTVPRSQEKEFDTACKPVRDFVKRLLGRIVFLHFLQRKGWLGCDPKRRDWRDGDRDFMLHYLELAENEGDADQFHSRWLAPLFFNALNTADRARDLFERTGTRIPYLNGGLFEETLVDAKVRDLPANYFRELLEFFGQYNFTIDENDPEENEIGIDPEMLGHIFENLLEDNKDKGAYYTPKAIVRYMCQQALLHYLRTHVGEHPELDTLVIAKEVGVDTGPKSWIRQNGAAIERLIDNAKICDPAVGSGAFPIGMLNEMLQIKAALHLTMDQEATHQAKKQLVENCLHGVDIDPGAIEIARLRFWLSLVVDASSPEPLPNLDYKLYCADSLVERVRGEPVNVGSAIPKDPQLRIEIRNLTAAKHKLYVAHSKPAKREARHELYAALAALVLIELKKLTIEGDNFTTDEFGRIITAVRELDHLLGVAISIKQQIDRKEKGAPSRSLLDRALDDLQAWFEDPAKPTFLWQLQFGEIFAPPAGAALDGSLNLGDTLAADPPSGFDIVIENPPYVSAIDHKKAAGAAYRSTVRSHYDSARGAWDLYVPFFELSNRILRRDGILTLICPNKYLAVPYAENLRTHLLENASIHELADVSRENVFIEADVYPVISRIVKSRQTPSIDTVRVRHSAREFGYDNVTRRVIAADLLRALPQNIWAFLLVEHSDLLLKLVRNSDGLTGSFEVNATTTAAEADELGTYLDENGDGWRVANTGTIDPYICLWGTRPLVHQGRRVGNPTLRYDVVSNANRERMFRSPKLVFAKMAKRFEGFVDDQGDYAALNVNCVHTPTGSWSLRSLSAYCHSKVFHFIYTSFFDALRMAGGYLPFQAPLVRSMRLPRIAGEDAASLQRLSAECEDAAMVSNRSRLAALEAEVDQIVYRLFDLNPGEIALIEGSTVATQRKN